MKAASLGRRTAAIGIVLACTLGSWCPRALALDPALDVGQYAHTAWRIDDGFLPGQVTEIAQTPDGYLWIGTPLGVFRFDGVRFVPWQPPDGGPLPGPGIRSLAATRDGALWIGTLGGLVSFRDGRRTSYPELTGRAINEIREDRDGTVWLSAQTVAKGWVCSISNGQTHCDGGQPELGSYVGALYEDSGGRLWVASSTGLWRWTPAPATRFSPPYDVSDSLRDISEHDDGEILIATRAGLRGLVDGRFEGAVLPAAQQQIPAYALLRDRAGALWIGTRGNGLLHVHDGRIDAFSRADGLSGDAVEELFEDREGNVWVATRDGLDRFREFAVATLTSDQGLLNSSVMSVLGTADGSVWVGTIAGLHRWDSGRITVYRERVEDVAQTALPSALAPPAREVREIGAPDDAGSLFEDRRGRLWIGALDGVGYLEGERFVPARGIPGGSIDSFAEDRSGNLWIAHRGEGLFRLSSADEIERIPWAVFRDAGLGADRENTRIAADPQRGGLWVGFRSGVVTYFADAAVGESYSAANGLAAGNLRHVRVDAGGVVWVATEGGLSRIDGGRIATLNGRNGLPCDVVDWTIEDDVGSTWLLMACGIVRIDRAELDAWAAATLGGDPEPRLLTAKVFDSSDGVRNTFGPGTYAPHVTKSRDGKLWFATEGGVGVVDPSNLLHNALPPPVHVEQIVADREPYDMAPTSGPVQLPSLVRDLRIDYTALSLVAPEKMQFRYRLEGHEEGWQDAGTRRQAFYTDLPPGDYRFQVIASNNDGAWNEAGASVAFAIAPTFYQTVWFALVCVAAAAGVLGLLYVLRVKQIEARVAMRLDERLAERERIARDLHDTFLQSVQGLMLKFQAVMARMPDDAPSRDLLEHALDRADDVLAEGRDRVYALRASTETQDLPQALTAVAAELTPLVPTEFRITVEGAPRAVHPLVREEAYRIGAEALRNAFAHAEAPHIGLEIEYSRRGLSLRIVDDGRGFDVATLEGEAGKHFGLRGLRERARKIRSQLEVSSRAGAGTEVRLHVPAAVAYAVDRRAKDELR